MTRMTFGRRSGVEVDVCSGHGTWFDGQELAAILAFAREGGLGDLARDRTEAAAAVLQVGLAVEAANERQEVETVTRVTSDLFDLLHLGARGF